MNKCKDCDYYTNGSEEKYCALGFSDIVCTDHDKFKPKEPIPVRTWKDGPFTLTNSEHYYIIMAEHKYTDDPFITEYSGMKHATIESARMELAYADGDDWGRFIKSLYIKEIT